MNLSDAERPTLLMLCDIYEHLGIENSCDPAFVRKAITEGNTWALRWRYSGIFEPDEATDEEVRELNEILEMWRRIEWSYSQLSGPEQETVNAAGHGYAPVFYGFDGTTKPPSWVSPTC